MGKRKSAVLIDSDDSRSSDSDSSGDSDKELLSLAKKTPGTKGAATDKKVKVEDFSSSSSSGSGSDSNSDWGSGKSGSSSPKKGKQIKKKPSKRARRSASGTTQSSVSADEKDSDNEPSASEVTSTFVSPAAPILPPPSSSVVSSSVPNNEATKKTPSDLEEGEVSDDDDQDMDDEDEEFTDGYDDNMMGDAEDQRRLSAMTEKEREQEIYRRIEKRDALKGRFEAERKLRRKKKLEAKLAKKGKKLESSTEDSASDAFQMDAKVRSQERKKTVEGKVDKKTQAMDALKASRDAKIQRAQEKEKIRQEQEKKREEKVADEDDDDDIDRKDGDASSVADKKNIKKLKASDVYSDDSGSDYDDEPGGNKEKNNKSASDSDSRSSDSEDDDRTRKPQFVEKVEDLNRIRVSRFKLEKWLYLPFFPRVLKGCFVRVGVGLPGQKSTYRICEIMDVVETSKIYQFGATRTNKGLKLRFGSDEKTFRFEFVSNQSFSDEEFTKWKDLSEMHSIAKPTLDEITKKEKEIREALDYQLQEEDIEAIITEKKKFKNAPVNFAAKKTELMKQREMAVTNGDEDTGAEISIQIQELDARAQELDKMRTSTISSIGYINERNRKKNVEEAEKAILEELKLNKGLKVEDPFTRRNTKPRIVSKSVVPMPNGSENFIGLKVENGGTDTPVSLDVTKLANLDTVDGLPPLPVLNLDDPDSLKDESVGDLFSAHDFDIKLDLDAKLPPNLPIVARPSMTPIKDTAPRRSLNLEEYKRKKGLI